MAAHTDNSVVIKAPLVTVWEMTNDLASWPELFTEYAAVDVIEQRDGVVRFRLTTRPDGQGRTWTWISEREIDEGGRAVRSRRVETGVFKYMNLYWEYEEIPAGVRMRWVQDFEMRPGAHADDSEMARHLNQTTREQQEHIRTVIEKAAVSTTAGWPT
jgi:aromatase